MSAAGTAAVSTDLDATVQHLREALQRNRFPEVVDGALAALAAHPGHRDLLYFLAVAQRMLQRIPQALDTLGTLEAYHPKYPRLFQERGHCHVFRRDAPEAIRAFEQAVRLNPALPASWKSLQTLYRMTGRADDARNAGRHVAKLAALPLEITTARSMLEDGNARDAEALIRPYLARHPDDVEALRLLANIARGNEFTTDAEVLLERVLKLEPGYNAARYDLVLTLVDLHKHRRAREEAQRLLAAEPTNTGVRITYAGILTGLGELDEAIERYRRLIEQIPGDPELHQSLGHALKTTGESSEAVSSYRRAAELRPGFGEPFWSLANLKTYRFSDEELDRMRSYVAQPHLQRVDRYHLCFALGKGLEDRGQFAESFAYYERGNALKREGTRYRAAIQERAARRQQEICTAEFFAARRGWGCDSAAPIFIVGLPRAGSTLLEQILASHSEVEGTMELANVPRLVGSLGGNDPASQTHYPDVLTDLTAQQCLEFGEAYIRDTLDYRTGKPYFIDKMPNNFRNIALIQLMLPNSRIIDARRDAMDCCFSNFRQLYATGHAFAYSLEDIGRYYRAYTELMDHWDRVLPGRILRVRHEDVLEDLEGSVRRILEYCGLPFEPACIEFYNTQRRVHTASAEQVRRPVNREGVGQWRNFDQWLGPLRMALGPLAGQSSGEAAPASPVPRQTMGTPS
jgi:predicted Zn-dependent protease